MEKLKITVLLISGLLYIIYAIWTNKPYSADYKDVYEQMHMEQMIL